MKPLPKEESSMLCYVESCSVDRGAVLDSRKVNGEDRAILEKWNASGFVLSGRVKFAKIRDHGCTWVRMSEAAWEQAAFERRQRALRGAPDLNEIATNPPLG